MTDNHGWDVLIETANQLDPTDPLTMHEPNVECKIQIKSTDKNKRAVQVTLSNLHKMASTPLPAFYALLEFDDNDIPTSMYLLHVDNELTRKILLKIRQLTAANKKTKLNEKNMTLKFTNEMRIIAPFGKHLKGFILATVGISPTAYVREKQLFLDRVGFEKGKHEFRFNIEGNEQLEKLVSMSLGTGGSVEVKDVLTMVTRFGISEELPQFRCESAVVEILKVTPDSKGDAEFRFPSTGLALNFEIDVYKNGLNDWVPAEMRRVRIRSKLLDIHIGLNFSQINILIRLDSDELVDLAEATKAFKLYNALRTPQKLTLTLKVDNKIIPMNLDHTNSALEYFAHLNVIETLQSLKNSFEHYDKLEILMPDIWKKAPLIELMSAVINNRHEHMSLKFPLSAGPGPLAEAHVFNVVDFIIGKTLFLVVYVVTGEVKKESDEVYVIMPRMIEVLYKTIIHKDDAQVAISQELLSKLVSDYETCNVRFDMTEFYIQILRRRVERQ